MPFLRQSEDAFSSTSFPSTDVHPLGDSDPSSDPPEEGGGILDPLFTLDNGTETDYFDPKWNFFISGVNDSSGLFNWNNSIIPNQTDWNNITFSDPTQERQQLYTILTAFILAVIILATIVGKSLPNYYYYQF